MMQPKRLQWSESGDGKTIAAPSPCIADNYLVIVERDGMYHMNWADGPVNTLYTAKALGRMFHERGLADLYSQWLE